MDDDCRQVLRELQGFLDGEDAQSLHLAIERHLNGCAPCMDRAEFQRQVRILIASKCTDCAPDGLVDRVTSQLWPSG